MAAAAWQHGFPGTVCSQGPSQDVLSSLAVEDVLVCSCKTSPSLQKVQKQCIGWWLQKESGLPGIPFQVPPPSLLLYTDASMTNWDSYLKHLTAAAGVWSQEERELHINILEMNEIQLTLNVFLPRILGVSVVLMSDSATMMACLKKQRGSVSRVMCILAQEIMAWTELNSVTLSIRYILRKKNALADQLSHPDPILLTTFLGL